MGFLTTISEVGLKSGIFSSSISSKVALNFTFLPERTFLGCEMLVEC